MAEVEKVTIGAGDVGTLDLLATEAITTKEQLLAREAAVGRKCRGALAEGAREKINALLVEGKMEEAEAIDSSSRAPCGEDLNKIFLAGELDGQIHQYVCPKCGLGGFYRAAGPIPAVSA